MSILKLLNNYPGNNNQECWDVFMGDESSQNSKKLKDYDKYTSSDYPPVEIMLEREKWLRRMIYIVVLVILLLFILSLIGSKSRTEGKADANIEVAAPQHN